jgi:AcrR family transcriptional regulator
MNKSVKIVQKKKPDRRVQRTRQLLRDALIALVIEKGYEATTVQDILDRANIGRSTFYAHFSDRDELLVSCFEHLQHTIEQFDGQMQNHEPTQARRYDPTLAFFRYAAEQQRFYKAMLGKQGGEIVQGHLYKYISRVAGGHIKSLMPKGKKTPVPQEILVHHITSSFLAILTWWLQRDMPYSPEQIDEMYHRLTLPGINAGLGK